MDSSEAMFDEHLRHMFKNKSYDFFFDAELESSEVSENEDSLSISNQDYECAHLDPDQYCPSHTQPKVKVGHDWYSFWNKEVSYFL